MALRDLARAWLAWLAHALALAGLREPGAPLPPPSANGTPLAKPWPEPPPPRPERPEPLLDGDAARERARREALLIPALAVLIGLVLAQAASWVDGDRLLPEALRTAPVQMASGAPRRSGWPRKGRGPTPGRRRRVGPPRERPASPRSQAMRLLAGMMAALAGRLGRTIVRQHRQGRLDSRPARSGLAAARRLNRWSIALIARGGPQGQGKGVHHG